VAGRPLSRCIGEVDAGWIEKAAGRAFGALALLHGAGVLHADLNPDNVIVADDAHAATIVDFGLARWPGAPPMPDGPFRGTLAYAAPEVARGERFDPRADLFALASTLLHVACDEVPRAQDTPASMLLAAGEAGIEPWATRAARSLSAPAAAVLTRCCAFDAAARPACASDVVRAIASG
jgi:serine/threonine protein kinase